MVKHVTYEPILIQGNGSGRHCNRTPLRRAESPATVRQSKGDIWVVEEHLIATALMELRKLGFEVEPTTVATFAAYDAIAKTENHKLAVLAGCGSGTKK